jgi:single-strand DNA-binding protein
MKTYNRATVIGHVGNEVVMRKTQKDHAVVNLRVATNFQRKGGEDVTTWHRVVLWDKLAELAAQYVTKGQALYLEGPLQTREWTDEHGSKRYYTEMVAREMIFLGGNRPANGAGPVERVVQTGFRAADGEEMAEVVENIPF